MRRSIPIALIALAALAAPAGATEPVVPAGSWDLQTTSVSYAGPPGAVRRALARLIQRRVTFSSSCTGAVCATYATVRTPRGRQLSFVLKEGRQRGLWRGGLAVPTGVRCGGRALRARLTFTAVIVRFQMDRPDRLTGSTTARAANPGGCAAFAGHAAAVRKTQYVGVAANG